MDLERQELPGKEGLTNETPRSPAAFHAAVNSQMGGADGAVPDCHLDDDGGGGGAGRLRSELG